MINNEIKSLKEGLLTRINDSLDKGVPVSVVNLVLENLTLQVKPLVDQACEQEKSQLAKQKEVSYSEMINEETVHYNEETGFDTSIFNETSEN